MHFYIKLIRFFFYCFYSYSLTMLFKYFIFLSKFTNLCSIFSVFEDKLFSKSDNFYIFSVFSEIFSLFSLIFVSNVSIFSFCKEICFCSSQILSSNSVNFSYDSLFCFSTLVFIMSFCY